jgi:hypothetical protein
MTTRVRGKSIDCESCPARIEKSKTTAEAGWPSDGQTGRNAISFVDERTLSCSELLADIVTVPVCRADYAFVQTKKAGVAEYLCQVFRHAGLLTNESPDRDRHGTSPK